MFKLDTLPTAPFQWPVDLPVAVDGGQKLHRVQLLFKRLSRAELADVRSAAQTALSDGGSTDALDRDVDYLLRFVAGWTDVEIGGSPDFTPEALRTLLDAVPSAGARIAEAYFAAVGGEGPRKN